MIDNIAKSYEPIHCKFEILAIGETDTNNIVNLSTLANELVTKIKIESSDDNITEASIDFEFAPSIDSYISKDRMLPPWVLFETIGNLRYTYVIRATILTSKKNVEIIQYDTNAIKEKIKNAISAYTGNIKPLDNKDAAKYKEGVQGQLKGLVKALRGIDDAIGTDSAKRSYIEIYSTTDLAWGKILTNSYSGGDDGVIKFNLKILERFTAKDRVAEQVSKQQSEASFSGFELADTAELLDFVKKAIIDKKGSLKDFFYLLLGFTTTDGGNTYAPGTRALPEVVSATEFNQNGVTSTPKGDYTKLLKNREEFKKIMDEYKIKIDSSSLQEGLASFLSYMAEVPESELRTVLNKQPRGGFFDADVIRNIKNAASNSNSNSNTLNSSNKDSILRSLYKVITGFITATNTKSSGSISNYFDVIFKKFGIRYETDRTGEAPYIVYRFYTTVASPKAIFNPLSKTISTNLIVLDYGGLVNNFNYSLRSGGVNVKELSSGGNFIVTSTLSNGITLNYEINKDKIKNYANTQEAKKIAFTSYVDLIRREAERDPDGFLMEFVDTVAGANAKVDPQPPSLSGVRGTQFLALELRHPVPIIGRGTPIFFTTITDNNRSESALTTQEGDVRSYILPPKVKGIYIVTKVTHVFNGKENTWVQTLECER